LTLQCTGTIIISPNPPPDLDWTKKAVTPVVNQGDCGSSYAISAIGAVEGLYALRVGKLDTFSVQQIVDCSFNYGNEGCYGGFMDQAFWYIIDNGLATSKSYPTKNNNETQSCKYTKTMKTTSFSKCADVPEGNYTKLLSAVIQQPTSVAIDARGMKKYAGGIYNGECNDSYINQAMLIVGYGTEDNQTYWKIKNSFGPGWGDGGYLLLERE
jgi:C1A family cysteine protease